MPIRKAWIWLILIGAGLCTLFTLVLAHPVLVANEHRQLLRENRNLVRDLLLTDICLFTEASYTRNLSQADQHAPFQDNPMAFDYFPSGSLVLPPVLMRTSYEEMADDAD